MPTRQPAQTDLDRAARAISFSIGTITDAQALEAAEDVLDTLRANDPLNRVRECFLSMIADARRWVEDVDGEYHTDSPTPTITVTYFAELREYDLRQLVEALGMEVNFDETAGSTIERWLQMEPVAVPAGESA